MIHWMTGASWRPAFFSLKLSGRLLVDDEATTHEETEVSQNSLAPPDPARLRLIDVGAMGGIAPKRQPHLESITPCGTVRTESEGG